jgi:hypothetical protein
MLAERTVMGLLNAIRPAVALCGFALLVAVSPADAQGPTQRRVYYPLEPAAMPTGTAAEWAAKIGKGAGGYFQPVRIGLPGGGKVTYFNGGPEQSKTVAAPSQAGLLIGPVYRLKLSDMPDFPGTELFPSIEVLDRLHPPVGRASEYPVPIEFTEEEIEAALAGRFVTKVVYLEQPNRALPLPVGRGNTLPTRLLGASENPLYVADLAGRPMLIVRLGGRLPDPQHENPAFFGTRAPLQIESPRDSGLEEK